VRDENDRHLGLVYLDLFPRDTKRSGAWCTSLLKQGEFRGEMRRPQAYIAASFSPPTDGRPSLLAWGEVKTLFHELGHALHDILSDCESQTTSGTSVLWDFVELPSQFMEYWLVQPAVLQSFARHYETGEPIPTNLIKAVRESENYLASVVCLDGANFARLDVDYHTVDPATLTDVEAFESERFSDWRIVPHPEGSCFSCSFQHIFLGGYSAGMYSYQWAEVLAADAFEYFQQNGLFNEEIAKSYRDNILKKGNSQHPMDLYKAFRGREPDPDAYFRVKGMI